MSRFITYIIFQLISIVIYAQFAPAAGNIGSTAMHKDSSAFVDWANLCVLQRGLKNISKPDSGYVNVGNELSALAKAGDGNFVSLGDGGTATLTFVSNIYNGPGYDFAVFENSFDGQFLELAHVEVSSDGVNFYRFYSNSNTDTTTQTNSFGLTDPTKINNLAGKYIANYGTPFDLEELSGISGLDIMNISHIKIIDVIGSINQLYCSRDGNNRPINDPWPTEFPSGGFDLDGVGVIHSVGNSINPLNLNSLYVYPNQINPGETIYVSESFEEIVLIDITGKKIKCTPINNTVKISPVLNCGIYNLQIIKNNKLYNFKLVIKA